MIRVITGATGLVGSALLRALPDARSLSHSQLDITDGAAVSRLRADLIFNCAVIGVDDCERDPALARRVNVDGPAHLAEGTERSGAILVHFSSNYVFDGEARRSYSVEDEPHPINVYGKTKLDGERVVAERCSRAIIVRTSWVYGPNKNNFLSTVATRLKRGEHVQAITDTWASCTYVDDLVERVMEIVEQRRFGTVHVANDGVCSYEIFAREAARLVEIRDPQINPIHEAAMKREAPRPAYTPMECVPPLRPWQEALAAYLAESPSPRAAGRRLSTASPRRS